MQVLLLLEHFGQPIELQVVKGKEDTHACTKTPNSTTPSIVRQWEPHEANNLGNTTLPKEVSKANQKDDSYISIRAHLNDPTKYAKPEGIKLKSCRISKSLLMKRNQLWVPDDKGFRLRVIKEIHDQLAVGHPGKKQTSNMIQHHYYWPHMRKTIEQYVWNCHVCRRAKAVRDAYNGLLQLLPVPKKPWVNVTMDFVIGLPKYYTYGQIYDAIFMVIDRLLKKCHYILYLKDNESISAKATAKFFMRYIWSREGLSISLTSDRGPQFAAKMWGSFCKLLGIKAKLSTAWHSKTNGQSTIANQKMEQYLRSYVNHFQDN